MPDEVCLVFHWGTQGTPTLPLPLPQHETKANFARPPAPLRFLLSLLFLAYVFIFGPSSPVYGAETPRGRFSSPNSFNPSYHPSGWGGDGLKNRLFFTFMFVEMMTWFWIWVTLREERNAIVERKSRRKSQSYNM